MSASPRELSEKLSKRREDMGSSEKRGWACLLNSNTLWHFYFQFQTSDASFSFHRGRQANNWSPPAPGDASAVCSMECSGSLSRVLLSFQASTHKYRVTFLFVQRKKIVKCKFLHNHLEEEKQMCLITFWRLQVCIWMTPYPPLWLSCGLWCSQKKWKPEVQILGRELTWMGQSWSHKDNEGKLGKSRSCISASFTLAKGLTCLKSWLVIWTRAVSVYEKRLFPYCTSLTFFISIDQQSCTALLLCMSETVPRDADTVFLSFSQYTGLFFLIGGIHF